MHQVLFSSHHTLHDYPDTNGILALDGFLQACKVREPEQLHGPQFCCLCVSLNSHKHFSSAALFFRTCGVGLHVVPQKPQRSSTTKAAAVT